MTPEMLDFVTYTGVDTSSQKLVDVTANLSGDLFELPAGALGFAVGYEHREEDGSYIPDPVLVAGETADVPTSPTAGGYDVDEVYGEVIVPILKDVTAFDSLSLSAAARVSDSDLFDSETGTKFSVNWGPTENLMLRASYAEGFRAPNIGELFNQGARFDSGISDQCNTAGQSLAAGQLRDARRAGRLRAGQSADLGGHWRQPEPAARNVGNLHGRLQLADSAQRKLSSAC